MAGKVSIRAFAVLCVCALALIGCVRQKPPRTLPAIELAPQDEEASAKEASQGEGSETLTATATQTAKAQATTIPSTTPMPTETATVVPTVTPVPSATPPQGVPYMVQDGDSLPLIAARYRTTPLDIMDANQLETQDDIYVGQTLYLPITVTPEVTAQLTVVTGPAAASTSEPTIVHVVRAGETLGTIAERYNTTVSDLLAWNPQVADPTRLSVGTKLVVQPGDTPSVLIHVVSPGETLAGIAARYGVSMQSVVQANGLANPNRIQPGARLVIPR